MVVGLAAVALFGAGFALDVWDQIHRWFVRRAPGLEFEIYAFFIVQPLAWISREILWKRVDQRVLDGAGVNGAARGARALGWLASRMQTGQVGIYVTLFVVGVLAILWRVTS